jgi:hypothetical protein
MSGERTREEIAARAVEWETTAVPPRARKRALWRLVPAPLFVAYVAVGAGALLTGQRWALFVAAVVAFYNAFHVTVDDRLNFRCETADHWVGNGQLPDGMTEACPYCRPIPFRELWRGGWKGGR